MQPSVDEVLPLEVNVSLIGFIVLLIVLGLAGYIVNQFLTIDARIKNLINIVIGIAVLLVVVFFCLQIFGVNTNFDARLR